MIFYKKKIKLQRFAVQFYKIIFTSSILNPILNPSKYAQKYIKTNCAFRLSHNQTQLDSSELDRIRTSVELLLEHAPQAIAAIGPLAYSLCNQVVFMFGEWPFEHICCHEQFVLVLAVKVLAIQLLRDDGPVNGLLNASGCHFGAIVLDQNAQMLDLKWKQKKKKISQLTRNLD